MGEGNAANIAVPVATAAANVAGGIIGAVTAKRRMKRANKMNIQNWHMQNAYNHPKAQMQRLQEAGLNPNLVYGGSGDVGGQAGPPPDHATSDNKFNLPDALTHMMMYQQLRAAKAQADNLKEAGKGIQISNGIKYFDYLKRKEYALYNKDNALNASDILESEKYIKGTAALEAQRRGTPERIEEKVATELDLAAAVLNEKQLKNKILETQQEWAEAGIRESDPAWLRSISLFLHRNPHISENLIRWIANRFNVKIPKK